MKYKTEIIRIKEFKKMIIQFLEKMANYGVYVWTSFSFVTVACSVFYYKTKKTLSKYEKEYF